MPAGNMRACLWLAAMLVAPLAGAAEAPSPPDYGMRLETAWIPMPDGVRLAADLYMPSSAKPGGADQARFPVLLEYLPYRKDESRDRNHRMHRYFVERGYVVAAVDIRGTGNSEGRLVPYEYSDQEWADGDAVLDWLAAQPWSTGRVGMFGISWGGFNAIQMAGRGHPALKAIIAIDATEDLYQEDVHYIDGIMHVDSWEMSQELYNAMPGAPDYVIDAAYFANRFDTEPWVLSHKRQQRDGPYWDRASWRDRHHTIKIPSFHIGGWYDGYRNSLPRMLERVDAPVKALIGPWIHAFPHEPYPEPGMEWRHEAVRWFDHWLKGRNTGIMDEPAFAVYMREWHPPGPYLEMAPGYWRWLDGWPAVDTEYRTLYAQPGHGLGERAPEPTTHRLKNFPTIGYEASGPVMWWGDVAHDQRGTDAYSLVYETPVLDEETAILGLPRVLLQVAADAPRANWYVRLSDVAPDGQVTLITGAGFNGTHRESAREPRDLVPGEFFALDLRMLFTSWVFAPGHRIRLSISNAQWPMFWPTPHPVTTALRLGGDAGARLVLPVLPATDRPGPAFLPPVAYPGAEGFATLETEDGTASGYGEISSVERNPQTGEVTVRATSGGASQYPWGTETYRETIEHRTSDDNPAETSMTGTHLLQIEMPERTLRFEGGLDFRSDAENFYYDYFRRLTENGELVREKRWTETIPRDHQ